MFSRGVFEGPSLGGLNKNHSSKNKNHSSIPFQNMATTYSVKISNIFLEERNKCVCNVQTMVPVPFLLNKMHSSWGGLQPPCPNGKNAPANNESLFYIFNFIIKSFVI